MAGGIGARARPGRAEREGGTGARGGLAASAPGDGRTWHGLSASAAGARDRGATDPAAGHAPYGERLRELLEVVADTVLVVTNGPLLSVNALVRRERFDVATGYAATIVGDPGSRWSISRPWPPYSFVPSLAELDERRLDRAHAFEIGETEA